MSQYHLCWCSVLLSRHLTKVQAEAKYRHLLSWMTPDAWNLWDSIRPQVIQDATSRQASAAFGLRRCVSPCGGWTRWPEGRWQEVSSFLLEWFGRLGGLVRWAGTSCDDRIRSWIPCTTARPKAFHIWTFELWTLNYSIYMRKFNDNQLVMSGSNLGWQNHCFNDNP